METNKRMGRPPSGTESKIMVSVRALKENKKAIQEIGKMDKVFHLMRPAGDFSVDGAVVKSPPKLCVVEVGKDVEMARLKSLNMVLADESAELRGLIAHWESEYYKAMAMSDDAKVHFWRSKCLAMEKAMDDGSS